MPDGHVPRGGPAAEVRWPADVEVVVLGVLAVHGPDRAAVAGEIERLRSLLGLPHGPGQVERAVSSTADGVDELLLCYWTSQAEHDAWWTSATAADWWAGARSDGVGRWAQVISMPRARHETMYSAPVPIGPAGPDRAMGLTDVHDYQGAFVDRMPEPELGPDCRLTDAVPGDAVADGRDVGRLCVIRTEQDWSAAPPEQVTAYLERVRPTLQVAIDKLGTHPEETQCLGALSLRYVDVETGAELPRTAVLGWWPSHEALGKWSAGDPSHLAILQTFWVEMVEPFNVDLRLLLWHEVGLPSRVVHAATGCGHPLAGIG
jgi:hypothetical protein